MDKPDIACMGCGWMGGTDELQWQNECDETGPFVCPECQDPSQLLPYDEYAAMHDNTETEGCPDL
jgi:hypothetical protein